MSDLFTCHTHADGRGSAPSAAHRPLSLRQGGKGRIIDIHCHMAIPAADALMRPYRDEMPGIASFTSPQTEQVNREQFRQIGSRLSGLEERFADMDRLGIDVQVISPSPGQYYYAAPPDLGRQAAMLVNDGIATAVHAHPDRLAGLGTVPLQNREMAIAELKRCVGELGLKGVEINTNVAGRELADPELRPFFAAAEALDVLLFLHPLGFTHGERLSDHYFNNLIGNPLESTIAVGHLIFGGVLDRYPRLKLCVAHGGGYLPGYWGRMDHAWRARADCREHISNPPSSYLRRLYLDTLVFDRAQLDFLVATHGYERLLLGTDYPFDMAEPDPLAFHSHLPEAVRRAILGDNAALLLGLS